MLTSSLICHTSRLPISINPFCILNTQHNINIRRDRITFTCRTRTRTHTFRWNLVIHTKQYICVKQRANVHHLITFLYYETDEKTQNNNRIMAFSFYVLRLFSFYFLFTTCSNDDDRRPNHDTVTKANNKQIKKWKRPKNRYKYSGKILKQIIYPFVYILTWLKVIGCLALLREQAKERARLFSFCCCCCRGKKSRKTQTEN